MSITIRVWDLWVRLEKYVNLTLGKRVRKILQAREVAKADAFLKKFRARRREYGDLQEPFVGVKAPLNPKCRHLKGGSLRRGLQKDYCLAAHRFSNGRTKIWCLLGCGLVAWNGEKNFENLRNMMEQSTNTPTASEIWNLPRSKEVVVTVQDKIPNG